MERLSERSQEEIEQHKETWGRIYNLSQEELDNFNPEEVWVSIGHGETYTLEELLGAQKNGGMRELFTDPFLGGNYTPADVGIDITQIADGTSEI